MGAGIWTNPVCGEHVRLLRHPKFSELGFCIRLDKTELDYDLYLELSSQTESLAFVGPYCRMVEGEVAVEWLPYHSTGHEILALVEECGYHWVPLSPKQSVIKFLEGLKPLYDRGLIYAQPNSILANTNGVLKAVGYSAIRELEGEDDGFLCVNQWVEYLGRFIEAAQSFGRMKEPVLRQWNEMVERCSKDYTELCRWEFIREIIALLSAIDWQPGKLEHIQYPYKPFDPLEFYVCDDQRFYYSVEYDYLECESRVQQSELEKILPCLPSGVEPNDFHILCCGCNRGFLPLSLARRGYRVLGIDESEKPLLLREYLLHNRFNGLPNLSLAQVDYKDIPGCGFMFDLILMLNIMPQDSVIWDRLSELLSARGSLIVELLSDRVKDSYLLNHFQSFANRFTIRGLGRIDNVHEMYLLVKP